MIGSYLWTHRRRALFFMVPSGWDLAFTKEELLLRWVLRLTAASENISPTFSLLKPSDVFAALFIYRQGLQNCLLGSVSSLKVGRGFHLLKWESKTTWAHVSDCCVDYVVLSCGTWSCVCERIGRLGRNCHLFVPLYWSWWVNGTLVHTDHFSFGRGWKFSHQSFSQGLSAPRCRLFSCLFAHAEFTLGSEVFTLG